LYFKSKKRTITAITVQFLLLTLQLSYNLQNEILVYMNSLPQICIRPTNCTKQYGFSDTYDIIINLLVINNITGF